MNAPRLGFVGVGWIGRHRMQAVLKSGAADAVAVMDASPEAVNEALKIAPDATRARTLDEMLASPDLDGVVIATPNALHAEQAIRALEAGKHVFCQKPLGRDAKETEAMVRAAQKADRVLGVDMSYRHTAAMTRIRELARQGAVGRIYAMDLVFHNAYGPDKPWFYDRARSGGGCLLDLGIHLVDLALWMTDFPQVEHVTGRLYEKGRALRPGDKAVEDYAVARIDLAGGASANLACSWRVSAGCDAVIGATFHGETGTLRMRNVDGSFYDFRADLLRGTTRENVVMPPDEWGGRAIEAWARRVAADPHADEDARHHVAVMDVLDRVYAP